MLEARTLKILVLLVIGYVLLALPTYLGPPFLEEISSYFVIVPFLSIHMFHSLGIPGLLQHGGYCGWGICAPTAFGWGFLILFWVGVTWLIAWVIARLYPGGKA